ncbi:DNA-binding response regulator [Myxococcus sp. K15C18031901]|uniref:DNA-binding response regulator n=1 Tax=Myxococcus dinghuensis TaxID=2906761 RepID=UPI0020A75D69|nr:DNA-binding response regulator [Myxococcus dinghuensis]MCP3104660.1 DNA-binding response regulator [Myxococcus dinghuensis]
MRRVLVTSPHTASRELLRRILESDEPGLTISATGDTDDALASIAAAAPAVVVVDLRRPDEDHPLFLGLLRKRHPTQPVIALVPGKLRVFDGQKEHVHEAPGDSAEALHQLLDTLKVAVRDLVAQDWLKVFRTPVAKA